MHYKSIRKTFSFIVFLVLLLYSSISYADIFVISRQTANIRSEPTTNSSIRQQAHKGDWFLYLGSNSTNRWREIELPDGRNGWVYYSLGRVKDDNYLSNISTSSDISSPGANFDIAKLEIHFINVKQGDCTLIIAYDDNNNKTAILFDAGKPGRGNQFIVPYLKSIGLSELNYIIASHNDSDHTGGLDEVLTYDSTDTEDYEIKLTGKAFVIKGDVSSTQRKEYDEFVDSVKAQTGENVFILSPPTKLPIANGIIVQAVTGSGGYIDKDTDDVVELEVNDANAKSIGLLITYKKFKFFVAGDLGGQSKHKYIENKVAPYIGDLDVLRVNHHGSNTSSHNPFLSITKPEVAIISTGSDNNYGHPRNTVIERLKYKSPQIRIYQTGEGDQTSQYKDLVSFEGKVSGNIVITTDGGCSYSVKGDGTEFSGTDNITNDDC